MTIIYVGLVACLALFLFLFSLPALQRCARWNAKRRQQAQWLRNAQQWAIQTAQAKQRQQQWERLQAERQQQWEQLQAARQPVKLSPRTEKIIEGFAKYIVTPLVVYLPALVIAVLFVGWIGFSTVCLIIAIMWFMSDFKKAVAEEVLEGLKTQSPK